MGLHFFRYQTRINVYLYISCVTLLFVYYLELLVIYKLCEFDLLMELL